MKHCQQIIILTASTLFTLGISQTYAGEPTKPASESLPIPLAPVIQPSVTEEPTPVQSPGSTLEATQAEGMTLQAEPYTLTAGDLINVAIVNIPEFSGQYQVQVDGTVDFPVLGSISVGGLTVRQVADLLTKRYTKDQILRDPTITVSLHTISGLRVALSGEVNRPGSYTLTVNDGKLPTLTEAIQKAGGITQLADLRQIKLIRARRSGANDTFQIDLWELLQAGDIRQDLTLRDGDRIVLAKAEAPTNPAEAGLIGAANISPAFIQVGILGETRQTGVVQVPPNTPLNQALFAAGGFSNRAQKGSVELIRLNRDGTVSRRKIQIDFSQGINEATNPILQNRDVVLVGRNFIAKLSDNLTAILGPVNQTFSIFTLFKALFPASSGNDSNVIIPVGGNTSTP